MHLPVSASCSRCWRVGCCRELGAGELQLRLRVRSGLDLVQLHLRGGTCSPSAVLLQLHDVRETRELQPR